MTSQSAPRRLQSPVIAVVGATGTGKSECALDLAERFGGEIVNADSMQVYQGMDIGTAKLPVALRRGIPHHLLDIWPVSKAANVAQYQQRAREIIAQIHSRGRLPIVVGGSGLYVRAVLEDFEFPGHDPSVRAVLEAELESLGSVALHRRLARVDPAAAARILPTNGRRVVRALEVIEITGGPFTAKLPAPTAHFRSVSIGLTRTRADLDTILDQRVERMWEKGFVSEVAQISGLAAGPTASRALGYRQILAMLAGDIDELTAKEKTKQATRKFARRQESWFRRDPTVRWIDTAESPLRRAQAVVQDFLHHTQAD